MISSNVFWCVLRCNASCFENRFPHKFVSPKFFCPFFYFLSSFISFILFLTAILSLTIFLLDKVRENKLQDSASNCCRIILLMLVKMSNIYFFKVCVDCKDMKEVIFLTVKYLRKKKEEWVRHTWWKYWKYI